MESFPSLGKTVRGVIESFKQWRKNCVSKIVAIRVRQQRDAVELQLAERVFKLDEARFRPPCSDQACSFLKWAVMA